MGSLRATRVAVLGAAVWALGACGPTHRAALVALQQRASFDLACPPAWLELLHIDGRTKVVSGCGHRLIYIEDCVSLDGGAECTWRVDGPPALAAVAWVPPQQGAPGPDAVSRPVPNQLFGSDPAAAGNAPRPAERRYAPDLFGGATQPIPSAPPGRVVPSELFGPPVPTAPAR